MVDLEVQRAPRSPELFFMYTGAWNRGLESGIGSQMHAERNIDRLCSRAQTIIYRAYLISATWEISANLSISPHIF
jgi:hypothetical protein